MSHRKLWPLIHLSVCPFIYPSFKWSHSLGNSIDWCLDYSHFSYRLFPYFSGKNHIEEIMYFENLRRSQLLTLIEKFRDVLILCTYQDAATMFAGNLRWWRALCLPKWNQKVPNILLAIYENKKPLKMARPDRRKVKVGQYGQKYTGIAGQLGLER